MLRSQLLAQFPDLEGLLPSRVLRVTRTSTARIALVENHGSVRFCPDWQARNLAIHWLALVRLVKIRATSRNVYQWWLMYASSREIGRRLDLSQRGTWAALSS